MSTAIPTNGNTGLIAIDCHGASKGGVDGDRVRSDAVHALEDVEFALVGPVVQPGFPYGGPRSTALWHVLYIEAVDSER